MKTLLVLFSAFPAFAALTASGPIAINGQSDVVIEGKKITNPNGDCVTIVNAKNVTIRASEIGPCKGNGIVMSSSSTVSVLDTYIHPEGQISGCCDKSDSIYARLITGLAIKGNVIAFGEANVEIQRSSNVVVSGNFLLNPRNGANRGQQVQCYEACSNVTIENNYTLASKDPKYKYPANQEDALNYIGGPAGPSTNAVVRGNYVQGGFSGSGCGIISDAGVSGYQILNNTFVDTVQYCIGVAIGANGTITGNKVRQTTTVPGGGNTALYVWNQYPSAPCGPTAISGNWFAAKNAAGAWNSYWRNGADCSPLTYSNNVTDAAALAAMTPIPPVPLIPPAPVACVATSPWTNQTSLPRCDGSPLPPDPKPQTITLTITTTVKDPAGTITVSAPTTVVVPIPPQP